MGSVWISSLCEGILVLRWPVEPMRAVGVAGLPNLSRAGLIAEPKWDGFRAVALVSPNGVDLCSRQGKSLTRFFPDVCRVLAAHLPPGVIIDGELIIWEESAGRTSFAALQQRLRAGRRIAHEAAASRAHLVCFDLLQDVDAKVLIDQPLSERRDRLELLLAAAPPELVLCPQTADEQLARSWFADWASTGIEGLVVKGWTSRYLPGRAGSWKKVKVRHTEEMIVGGCTGTIHQRGALLLGRLDEGGRLRYLAQTHPLSGTAWRELVGLVGPMSLQGKAAGHPWPSPLPASWSLTFADRRPLDYVQVEPSVVVEVEADVATGFGGRPRHLVRHVRTRADLIPEDLPLWP